MDVREIYILIQEILKLKSKKDGELAMVRGPVVDEVKSLTVVEIKQLTELKRLK